MKILVLVKHVPDATGDRRFADDGTLDRAGTDGLLSELDEYAVEQALRIADERDDVEVVAVTLGRTTPLMRSSERCRWVLLEPSTSTTKQCTVLTPGHQRRAGRGDRQGCAGPGDLRHGLDRRRHGCGPGHDR